MGASLLAGDLTWTEEEFGEGSMVSPTENSMSDIEVIPTGACPAYDH